jgi:thiamine-monophosphate kinase
MASEFDFIDWVRQQQHRTARVLLPAGDDLAILRWNTDDLLLVGVDQVLDGVHFDSAIHSPAAIGRKVMNRNLSDCAAMGCLPTAAVCTVAAPVGCGEGYLRDLYNGMRDAAAKYDCDLVGGDTASWAGKLVVTVTILGRSEGIAHVTRAGAKAGDGVFVSGPLGGSIHGRHMTFEPRIALGRRLAEAGVSSMIDLSDGLSRDLRHLCAQSGVGATIDGAAIPIHSDAAALPNRSPLERALHDGEDYELLFTGRGNYGPEATCIGTIHADPGLWITSDGKKHPLQPLGWEHAL